MQSSARRWPCRAFLVVALLALNAPARQAPAAPAVAPGDGQRDFDWEIGTWKTELRRLAKPLSGSGDWVEYSGTSVVRKVLDGRANLVELRVQGPAGKIEGASLRLFNPQSGQWNLHYANARNGAMTQPVQGRFRDGRGEFHGIEELDGRAVLVRFVISQIGADSARFEQAYSEDGGRSWETNWIAVDTRVDDQDRGGGAVLRTSAARSSCSHAMASASRSNTCPAKPKLPAATTPNRSGSMNSGRATIAIRNRPSAAAAHSRTMRKRSTVLGGAKLASPTSSNRCGRLSATARRMTSLIRSTACSKIPCVAASRATGKSSSISSCSAAASESGTEPPSHSGWNEHSASGSGGAAVARHDHGRAVAGEAQQAGTTAIGPREHRDGPRQRLAGHHSSSRLVLALKPPTSTSSPSRG